MKKIGILLSILLMMFYGYSAAADDNLIKSGNDANSIHIVSLSIPSSFPNLANSEEFQGVTVERNKTKTIEITFSEEIADDNYTLAYMQYANYYGIKNEYDEENHIFFKYVTDKNKLIITPQEGYPGSDIISVFIPSNVKSKTGKTLGSDKILIFSSNTLNDEDQYTFINSYVTRDIKSIMQVKSHNDGKRVAAVNKETYLYEKSNKIFKGITLERGESVLILEEYPEAYLVEIMFPKSDTKLWVSHQLRYNYFDVYENEYSYSVKGFVDKECIIELPEPLNEGFYYMAALIPAEYDLNLHIVVLESLAQSYDLIVWDIANKIEEGDLYYFEAAAISQLSMGFIFGGTYSTVYVDKNGISYPVDNVERHKPQYNWSEKDYSTYVKAYDAYCNYLLDRYDEYKFPDKLQKEKELMKNQIKNIIFLEKSWINWGYKNKLQDKNYFFDSVKKELPLDLQNIISETDYNYGASKEFETLKINFINTISLYYGGRGEVHNMADKINEKYTLKQLNSIINSIDRKNNILYVMDDEYEELYPILIEDSLKNELKLEKGEEISALCRYDFDTKIWNIKSINQRTAIEPELPDYIEYDYNRNIKETIRIMGYVTHISDDWVITVEVMGADAEYIKAGDKKQIKILDNNKMGSPLRVGERIQIICDVDDLYGLSAYGDDIRVYSVYKVN